MKNICVRKLLLSGDIVLLVSTLEDVVTITVTKAFMLKNGLVKYYNQKRGLPRDSEVNVLDISGARLRDFTLSVYYEIVRSFISTGNQLKGVCFISDCARVDDQVFSEFCLALGTKVQNYRDATVLFDDCIGGYDRFFVTYESQLAHKRATSFLELNDETIISRCSRES